MQMQNEPIARPATLDFLRRAMQRPAPVYLFIGGSHVGKATLAQWLAQGVLCLSEEDKPCGTCDGCRQVLGNVHPDVLFVDVLEDKRDVSIEQVHHLHQWLSQTSLLGGRRVATVLSAGRLSLPAANATLKILEESAAKAVVILIADSIEALPATVVSRCQLVRLQPVPVAQLVSELVERGADASLAQQLAVASYGRPGLAIEWLQRPEAFAEYRQAMDDLALLFDRPSVAWAAIESAAAGDQPDAYRRVAQAQVLVAEAARHKAGVISSISAASQQLAQRPWSELVSLWTGLANIGQTEGTNINIRILLEAMNLNSKIYAP